MSAHRHSARCSSCHRDAVVRPSAAFKLALVAGYVLFGAMVFGASLLGPTIMAALPLLVATGLGLLPWLHERAGAAAECRACGKLQPAEPEAAVRAGAPVAAASMVRAA
jgi:hypothetical protein